jgi:hypothetical protein
MFLQPRQISHLALFISVLFARPPVTQSGHGAMHGYVAFDDVSYDEVSRGAIHAKVELRGISKYNSAVYTAITDNHGAYDFPSTSLGEFRLTISAPGHATYRTNVYIPSDFQCQLGTLLKRNAGAP